uniref:NADH dehydrogenase subunit 9 n=1 Tax=Gruberia lanceolata TaxID=1978530 RepID=A0A6C0UBW3_9CILI|nr:NADH dehydrogenase subunit 9 [Gruberia lanceolata]
MYGSQMFFNYEKFNMQNTLNLLYFNSNANKVFLLLKFNSLFYSTFLLDTSVLKSVKVRKRSYDIFFFNFFNYIFSLKINLFVLISENYFFESIVKFFKNGFFTERENSEMHGINLKNNLDIRYLLLDYLFCGFPLLKNYPLSGFVELFYDYFRQLLYYCFLTLISQLHRGLIFDF